MEQHSARLADPEHSRGCRAVASHRWTVLFLILATVSARCAACATRLQVIATFPEGSVVTLGRNQPYYLRLRYHTDKTVGIWVRPFYDGREADAGTGVSLASSGSGEALGRFFLLNPAAKVDEVRITAGDGSIKGTALVATYPVRISGSTQTIETGPTPDWVTRLRAQEAKVTRADYERWTSPPASGTNVSIAEGLILLMGTLGSLALAWPMWALWRWRDGWRIAALVPAALMGFSVLRILIETSLDPTSHNLWPFEVLQVGAASIVIMLALVMLRKLAQGKHSS